MKKYFISLSLCTTFLATPLLALAQNNNDATTTSTTNQALSRQDVKSDLKNWENNGYKPGEDRADYPKQEQQVEKKIQKEQSMSPTSPQY